MNATISKYFAWLRLLPLLLHVSSMFLECFPLVFHMFVICSLHASIMCPVGSPYSSHMLPFFAMLPIGFPHDSVGFRRFPICFLHTSSLFPLSSGRKLPVNIKETDGGHTGNQRQTHGKPKVNIQEMYRKHIGNRRETYRNPTGNVE